MSQQSNYYHSHDEHAEDVVFVDEEYLAEVTSAPVPEDVEKLQHHRLVESCEGTPVCAVAEKFGDNYTTLDE